MGHQADVIVIGAGAAGLVTALNANTRRVTVITPDGPVNSGTASDLAQGGVAAAVGGDDSTTLHLRDTIEAGQAYVDADAARYLCREAPAAIAYLESLGVRFARDERGWALHTEAAHSRARVLHVGDATGAAVMSALRHAADSATHIDRLPSTRAIGLLRDSRGVCGVAAVGEDQVAFTIEARAVVIATGGLGGLFSRSTNPLSACGDGLAMALAAGATCSMLEFVQFHPTALDIDARPLPLLTEALRGAGATLIDEHGDSVMQRVHPLGDLAPRDIVARTVYEVQRRGGRVLLDATRVEHLDISAAFPSAHRVCLEHGFDLVREPVPVTPAAHYHMGGIAVDLDGRSSLPGLWAVGETACTGVHGANRLASNSLLEAVVFGRRLSRALVRERFAAFAPSTSFAVEAVQHSSDAAGRQLREMMWKCMGVVRSAATIGEGLGFVARLREQTPMGMTLQHARLLLVENMLIAAARRTVSCGAHFRSDLANNQWRAASDANLHAEAV